MRIRRTDSFHFREFARPLPRGGDPRCPASSAPLAPWLVGRQVVDATGKGPVVNGHDFFDLLDTLTNQVRGIDGTNGALYMNAALRARIASGFRRLGGSELMAKEIAGKPTTMWNGIPLLDAGQRLDGTDVLPLAVGTGSAATGDIYAVRFGASEVDAGLSGLTNGGVQVTDLGESHDKPAYRTRIDFYCGLALFGGKAEPALRTFLMVRPRAPRLLPVQGWRVRSFLIPATCSPLGSAFNPWYASRRSVASGSCRASTAFTTSRARQ